MAVVAVRKARRGGGGGGGRAGGGKHALVGLVVALAMLTLVRSARGQPYGVEAGPSTPAAAVLTRNTEDDLRVLVQAFVNETTHGAANPRSEGFAGVHPLPRAMEVSAAAAAVEMNKRQVLPMLETEAAPAVATAPSTSMSAAPVVQAASSASPSSSASASPSASSSQPPKITPASSSSSSSDSKSTSASSSSSSTKPSSTSTSAPSGIGSFFSPQSKLFPLAIALCVAIGLGSLFILISIGKCYSHQKMKQDERDGKRSYKSKDNSVLMAANVGRTRTLGKSLRRALTRGKLGGNSFARRNREGTVLIDVGDEVFAVTPEVAREYERERKSVLSSYQSSASGAGSRLTFPNNQPTPSRQALYNAQLIVAANQAEVARGKPQEARGFDINSWRVEASTLPGVKEDDERTLKDDDSVNKLGRSLSQRLANGFRALTGGARDSSGGDELGEPKTSNAFSFDTEKQDPSHARQAQVPLSATVPVLTRGGGGWAIQRQEADRDVRPIRANVTPAAAIAAQRAPRKHASDSTLRDSALSHERVVLRDDGPRAAAQQQQRQQQRAVSSGKAGAQRPKSILVKRSQECLNGNKATTTEQPTTGVYRNRAAQPPAPRIHSTAPGSPKMLQQRSNQAGGARGQTRFGISSTPTGAGSAGLPTTRRPIVLKPEVPAQSDSSSSDASSRDLYRPLPMPPAISPMALGGGGASKEKK